MLLGRALPSPSPSAAAPFILGKQHTAYSHPSNAGLGWKSERVGIRGRGQAQMGWVAVPTGKTRELWGWGGHWKIPLPWGSRIPPTRRPVT